MFAHMKSQGIETPICFGSQASRKKVEQISRGKEETYYQKLLYVYSCSLSLSAYMYPGPWTFLDISLRTPQALASYIVGMIPGKLDK